MNIHDIDAQEPRYYRAKDVAWFLGISPAAVYRMVAAGELQAVRAGKRMLLIPAEEVERLLAKLEGGVK